MPLRTLKLKKYKSVSELYRTINGKDYIDGYYVAFRDIDGKATKRRVPEDARSKSDRSLTVDDALLYLQKIKHKINSLKDQRLEIQIRDSLLRYTLGMAYEKWILTVSIASCSQYSCIYKNHIKEYLGHKIIDEIRIRDGEAIKLRLKANGYSLQTQNGTIAVLKILINWAIRNEYAQNNGVALIKAKKPKNNRLRLMTKEEIFNLIETSADEQLRHFITTLFYTVQRPSSLLRLQKKDIINDEIHFHPIKGQDYNVIPIHKELQSTVETLLNGLDSKDYVFHSMNFRNRVDKSLALSYSSIAHRAEKLFKPLNEGYDRKIDRAMIASLYSIRHSAATIILSQTGNQRLVQAVMNHAGGEMTARYAKILDTAKIIGINSL